MASTEIARPPLGALADRLFQLRAQRLDMAKQVDALKAQEQTLHEQILLRFAQEGMTSARGKMATVSERQVTRFSVADWDKALDWIARTGAVELLERRVSQTACRERFAAGQTIDGVEALVIHDLSITKKGAR